jgi:hypothetical protein
MTRDIFCHFNEPQLSWIVRETTVDAMGWEFIYTIYSRPPSDELISNQSDNWVLATVVSMTTRLLSTQRSVMINRKNLAVPEVWHSPGCNQFAVQPPLNKGMSSGGQ